MIKMDTFFSVDGGLDSANGKALHHIFFLLNRFVALYRQIDLLLYIVNLVESSSATSRGA